MFLSEYGVDDPAELILLLADLVVDYYDGGEFLPGIPYVLLCDLLPQNPLDFVGDAFADLVVFVDALVVLGERVVAADQHLVASLELPDVLQHPFVLVNHGAELEHLASLLLPRNFQLRLQLDDLVGRVAVVAFSLYLFLQLLLPFHH